MEQTHVERLEEAAIYAIGPQQADLAAPLLTGEARDLIARGEAFAMAIVDQGRARGAVCARLDPQDDELLELLSLYVEPAFRRRQLGGTLLLELLDQVAEATGGELRGVRALFPANAEGVEGLLTRAGFSIAPAPDSQTWRCPLSQLSQSPLMTQQGTAGGVPLGDLPEIQLRQICQTIERRGAAYLSQDEMLQAHPAFSFVLLEESGLSACAMFFQDGETLTLGQFFTEPGKTQAAVGVLQAAARVIIDRAPPQTVIEIPTLAQSSARLVRRLLDPQWDPVPLLEGTLPLT